jgi:hypothetical protein
MVMRWSHENLLPRLRSSPVDQVTTFEVVIAFGMSCQLRRTNTFGFMQV